MIIKFNLTALLCVLSGTIDAIHNKPIRCQPESSVWPTLVFGHHHTTEPRTSKNALDRNLDGNINMHKAHTAISHKASDRFRIINELALWQDLKIKVSETKDPALIQFVNHASLTNAFSAKPWTTTAIKTRIKDLMKECNPTIDSTVPANSSQFFSNLIQHHNLLTTIILTHATPIKKQ